MKLIICLDKRNKYAFFKKRQSIDESVLLAIRSIIDTDRLFVNNYTYEMLKRYDFFSDANIVVTEAPQEFCGENDFCFIETEEITKIPNEMFLFYWNRDYPGTINFRLDMNNYDFMCQLLIPSKSHPELLLKNYIRKEG